MTADNQQEYKLDNGQTISIQRNMARMVWEVACWNADDTAHWYKEFKTKVAAESEYNKWRK